MTPQLLHLATTPAQVHIITALMTTWKEGHLKTKGKARIGPGGQPKCAHLFSEITSEHFARRCEELGIPEHALAVYDVFATYVLPLTLTAARRLLHSLVAAERPLADIVTTTACYPSYGLPLANEGLPSCALLLSACLRHLKTTEEGKQRKDAEALIAGLISAAQSLRKTRYIWAVDQGRNALYQGCCQHSHPPAERPLIVPAGLENAIRASINPSISVGLCFAVRHVILCTRARSKK
ncbi:hypothetical protein B0H11DRAFT_2382124 [Mycena galericulata]|nr:hypothetical protein B0H11DRAFT_2382124 [Mycena galericulata]